MSLYIHFVFYEIEHNYNKRRSNNVYKILISWKENNYYFDFIFNIFIIFLIVYINIQLLN